MNFFMVSLIVAHATFRLAIAQADSIVADTQTLKQPVTIDSNAEILSNTNTLTTQQTPPEIATKIDSETANTLLNSVPQHPQHFLKLKPVFTNKYQSIKHQFNPLAYGRRLSFGIHIPYMYYHEKIPSGDDIRFFEDLYGQPPEFIEGKPKSTEYGLSGGFAFKYFRIFPSSGIMFSPQFSLILGPGNTYDGSKQGETITNSSGDAIGIRYKPFDTTKTNVFFNTEIDIGFSNHTYLTSFALFSGIRYSFWNRDLGSNAQIDNYENYYWASIPIGAMVYRPIGSQWVLGLEGVVDFMFYGAMQAELHARMNKSVGINFPEVSLGNKLGYRIELMIGKQISERLLFQIMPFVYIYGFGKSEHKYASISGLDYSSDESDNLIMFNEPESATVLIGINFSFNLLFSPLR